MSTRISKNVRSDRSNRVRKLLKDRGMTRARLAELTGVLPRTVYRWLEKGPDDSAVRKIARALRVPRSAVTPG